PLTVTESLAVPSNWKTSLSGWVPCTSPELLLIRIASRIVRVSHLQTKTPPFLMLPTFTQSGRVNLTPPFGPGATSKSTVAGLPTQSRAVGWLGAGPLLFHT